MNANRRDGDLQRPELALPDLFSPGIASHANSHFILVVDDHESDNETLQGMTGDKALYCLCLFF